MEALLIPAGVINFNHDSIEPVHQNLRVFSLLQAPPSLPAGPSREADP